MAAVDQALKEFGKIDILINCKSLLKGFLMGQQYQTSVLRDPSTSVFNSKPLSQPNSTLSESPQCEPG